MRVDAAQALAEAHRVDEAKEIRDKALAVAAYARQAKDRDMILWATEIKIRAERQVGKLLREMEKHPGGGPGRGKKNQSPPATGFSKPTTLKQLGLTKEQSADWQQLATIPEDEFEHRLQEAARDPRTMTTAKLLKPIRPPMTVDPFAERIVHVWSASPAVWRKMERLGLAPSKTARSYGTVTGHWWTIPLDQFRWGLKAKGRRPGDPTVLARWREARRIPRRVSEQVIQQSSGADEGVGNARYCLTSRTRRRPWPQASSGALRG